MTTQAVMRQRRVRYRSRSSDTRILSPGLSVLFWGPGILVILLNINPGSGQGSDDPFVIGVGAFLIVSGLGFIALAFLPVLVLTTHTLRRPSLLRRAQVTPLDQVTGIGLVCMRGDGDSVPAGWSLYLWTTGDLPRDVGIAYQPAMWLMRLQPADKVRQKFLAVEPSAADLRRPFDSYRFGFKFNPVTQTDPDKIAATYAGRVAREIYDRVLTYQGPSGLLAVRQDQKHVPVADAYSPYMRTAYWSPDGELGHVTIKPQQRRPVPRGNSPSQPSRPGLVLGLRYRLRLLGHKLQRRGNARGVF